MPEVKMEVVRLGASQSSQELVFCSTIRPSEPQLLVATSRKRLRFLLKIRCHYATRCCGWT